MAELILDSAEQQLVELLRGLEPNKLQLTIYRSSADDWKIELSFEAQDNRGRVGQRAGSGAGSTFAKAWEQLLGGPQ